MLGIAGALLVFTGLWHMLEWLMGGRNKDTLRLIPFGIMYVVLGYLIVTFKGGSTVVIVAAVVTLVGCIGAFLLRNKSQVRRWVTWVFIIIDLIILAALASSFIAA